MPDTPETAGRRFAAKLLFQFRVVVDGDPGIMRTCEERIVVFRASTAEMALATARRRGSAAEYAYENDAGDTVHFECVGVLELLHLGPECEEDEVWYEITRRKLPMERAAALLPGENELEAIREDRPAGRSRTA